MTVENVRVRMLFEALYQNMRTIEEKNELMFAGIQYTVSRGAISLLHFPSDYVSVYFCEEALHDC